MTNQEKKYTVFISSYLQFKQEVVFQKISFTKLPKEEVSVEEIQRLGVFDLKHYKLPQLKALCKQSYNNLKEGKIQKKIQSLTKRFKKNYPIIYEISPIYQHAFHQYLQNYNWQKKKAINVKKINPEQIEFVNSLMKNPQTMNYNLEQVIFTILYNLYQKVRLLNEKFPLNILSRSSVYKIQKKILHYSYKRITKFRPKLAFTLKNRLSKIVFINKYLQRLQSTQTQVVIIDGSFSFIHQQLYQKQDLELLVQGEQCTYPFNSLEHNLSMICAMSTNQIEQVQFLYKKGTTKEIFANFLEELIKICFIRYPGKQILFVKDNLRAHKTSEVWKVIQSQNVNILFLCPYSPEYSAIENLFGSVKKKLKDFYFNTKEDLANKIIDELYKISNEEIDSFFKYSFGEMENYLKNFNIELMN